MSGNGEDPLFVGTIQHVETLVISMYDRGIMPGEVDKNFLTTLKHHPRVLEICLGLLRCTQTNSVLQFAATLLRSSCAAAESPQFRDPAIVHQSGIFVRELCVSGRLSANARRDILVGYGSLFCRLPNWKEVFHGFVTSFQSDVFESATPNLHALESFFCLAAQSKSENSTSCLGYALDYFTTLLQRNVAFYDVRQADIMTFIEKWFGELDSGFSVNEKIGPLMIITAKFIDCPERKHFPWSTVQVSASATLAAILSVPDICTLQTSLKELMLIVFQFPIMDRMSTMGTESEKQGYLEVISRTIMTCMMELADLVVVSAKDYQSTALLQSAVSMMLYLCDPVPENSAAFQNCSRNAMTAMSELCNTFFELGISGSTFNEPLNGYLQQWLRILLRKAARTDNGSTAEEREDLAEYRRDLQKATNNLVIMVGEVFFTWLNEMCVEALSVQNSDTKLLHLESLLFIMENAAPYEVMSSSRLMDSTSRGVLQNIYNCFSVPNEQVVSQAFRALRVWIEFVSDEDRKDVIAPFVPVCLCGLRDGTAVVFQESALALSAIVQAGRRNLSPEVAIAAGKGSAALRTKLMEALGEIIGSFSVETACADVRNLTVSVPMLFANCKNQKDVLRAMKLFPGFFKALGSVCATEDSDAEIDRTELFTAAGKLGCHLLEEILKFDPIFTKFFREEFEKQFVALTKVVLYASGTAFDQIVPGVAAFAIRAVSESASPRIVELIRELLINYVDGPTFETTYCELVMVLLRVAIERRNQTDWKEYREFYAQFVNTFQPVVRFKAKLLLRMSVNWEELLLLVMSLAELPPSGDTSIQVTYDTLFEELVNMKPVPAEPTYTNPVIALIRAKYLNGVVLKFLEIAFDPYLDEATERIAANCLFALLFAMKDEVTTLMTNHFSAIASRLPDDPAQKAWMDKTLSSMLSSRTRPAFWRAIDNYLRKHRQASRNSL